MKYRGGFLKITIGKPGQEQTNEDSVIVRDNLMAVSDGAGGGGVYADKWSAYLVSKLPPEPITSFGEVKMWIDSIWEAFYDKYEKEAEKMGGLVLQKFYDEGSFATIAAVWIEGDVCRWMSYGDSVVFHYGARTQRLEHSFTTLADFNKPPYLISLHDELVEKAFHAGEYFLEGGDIVLCASDALAHYILMQYALSHRDEYDPQLREAIRAKTKNSFHIEAASSLKCDFERDVVRKLVRCCGHPYNFLRHMESRLRKSLISLDDYSCTIYIKQQ